MMKTAIIIAQLVFSILLISLILLQARGTGLGSLWGGSGESYRSKRGAEKIIFVATIVCTALFLLVAIANLLI